MRQGPDRALLAGAIAVGLLVIAVLVLLVPAWLVPSSVTPAQSQALQAQNDLRTTLLQSIGGLFLIAGVVATWRQVQLTRHQLEILREGQITERFTRAIEQLGGDNLDVRLGGIYALERIASSSKVDRGPILEVLTAYVRGHSPWPPAGWEYGAATPPEPDDRQLASLQFRKPDVQAVVAILGRREAVGDEELLLARVDLRRAYLRRANLDHANLRNSSLRGVQGRNTRLRGAVLKQADLTKAFLQGADLQGADLQRADLTGANLSGADLRGAALDGAVLRGIVTDEATRWPEGFMPPGA
jgi:hypothetical protein